MSIPKLLFMIIMLPALLGGVEEQIGTVTHYSNVEGKAKYSSDFSNYFEEGTKLYNLLAFCTLK